MRKTGHTTRKTGRVLQCVAICDLQYTYHFAVFRATVCVTWTVTDTHRRSERSITTAWINIMTVYQCIIKISKFGDNSDISIRFTLRLWTSHWIDKTTLTVVSGGWEYMCWRDGTNVAMGFPTTSSNYTTVIGLISSSAPIKDSSMDSKNFLLFLSSVILVPFCYIRCHRERSCVR